MPALGVERRLGRVDVLGLAVVEDPPAEGDDPAHCVENGKHQAMAEQVVEAAALAAPEQAGLQQQVLVGETELVQMPKQAIPVFYGITETELAADRLGQGAALDVLAGRLTCVGCQVAVIVAGCLQADVLQSLLFFLALAPGFVIRFGNGDAGAFGQKPDRLRIRALLDVHDEMDDVAAFVTAETVVDLLGRRHGKRRRLLTMERTEAEIVAAAFPVQVDVLLNDRHELVARLDFLDD